MRTPTAFLRGLLSGSVLVSGRVQELRLAGENYTNHVAVAVENFDEAVAFYDKKMGFREAFTICDDSGRPTLAYVQVSRTTFIELQQANANRRPVINRLLRNTAFFKS